MKNSIVLACLFACEIYFLGASDFRFDFSTIDMPSTELAKNVFSELTNRFQTDNANKESVLEGMLESFSLQSDIRHKSLLLFVILDVLEKYKALSLMECADKSVIAGICDEIIVSFVKTAQSIQLGNANVIKKKRWLKKRYLLAALFLLGGIALTIGISIPVGIKLGIPAKIPTLISVLNINPATVPAMLAISAEELDGEEKVERQKVKREKIEAKRERMWFIAARKVVNMFEMAEEECKEYELNKQINSERFVEIGTQTQIVRPNVLIDDGVLVDLDAKESEQFAKKNPYWKELLTTNLQNFTNGLLTGVGAQGTKPLLLPYQKAK